MNHSAIGPCGAGGRAGLYSLSDVKRKDGELLNQYHLKFLHHLVRHGVVFLIIGGQARCFISRTNRTTDLDIWARLNQEDIWPLEHAIVTWAKEHPQHMRCQNIVPPLRLHSGLQIKIPDGDGVGFFDLDGGMQTVGVKDGIDLLTSLRGFEFKQCMQRALKHNVREVTVYTLSQMDLDRAEALRRVVG
jgi:hypothetical protein